MVLALVVLGGLGAASAVLLGIAARVFYVKEDPRVAEVENALPGANCGGCGYAGCHACAEAIVRGQAAANACVVGGFDTAVQVAAMMGVKVEAKEPEIAATTCTYGTHEADLIYHYNGALDCQAAVALFGGGKLCPIGCIGLGSCVKACKFDALTIGADHLPRFNPRKCVACGACVKACPKHIIQLTSSSGRLMREYVTSECTAPCMRACPTGIDIPRYIAAVGDGRPEEALRIIKEKCPLPLICGRICPAPCELNCRRRLAGDDPVGINPLKRHAADFEMRTGQHVNPYKNAPTNRRVAVVGAGAEGLTVAYYLARLGHAVTLFEAKPELGGILRYVISPGRLPEGVLDHEIKGILEMGVESRTGQVLGRDFTVSSLVEGQGFDAVLLATGGYDSRKILHPDSEPQPLVPGLHLMVDVLQAQARGRVPALGERVAVVAGDRAGLELARSLRAAGAERVVLIARDSLEMLPQDMQEVAALLAEGIELCASSVVTGLCGRGDRLVGISIETEREGDGSLPETRLLDTDALIAAAGRVPELVIVATRPDTPEGDRTPEDVVDAVFPGLKTAPTWRTIEAFRTFSRAARSGILSSPEPGRGSDAAAVVKAILSGRRLVRAIHAQLSGQPLAPPEALAAEAAEILDVQELDGVSPVERQESGDPLREPSTESDWTAAQEGQGLSESQATQEAQRCLQCGLICYRRAR